MADSGPGLTRDQVRTINQDSLQLTDDADEGQHSESGLGLSIVQEVVRERGGHLAVGRSAEGGALLLMVVPNAESRPAIHLPRLEVLRPDTASRAALGGVVSTTA